MQHLPVTRVLKISLQHSLISCCLKQQIAKLHRKRMASQEVLTIIGGIWFRQNITRVNSLQAVSTGLDRRETVCRTSGVTAQEYSSAFTAKEGLFMRWVKCEETSGMLVA